MSIVKIVGIGALLSIGLTLPAVAGKPSSPGENGTQVQSTQDMRNTDDNPHGFGDRISSKARSGHDKYDNFGDFLKSEEYDQTPKEYKDSH